MRIKTNRLTNDTDVALSPLIEKLQRVCDDSNKFASQMRRLAAKLRDCNLRALTRVVTVERDIDDLDDSYAKFVTLGENGIVTHVSTFNDAFDRTVRVSEDRRNNSAPPNCCGANTSSDASTHSAWCSDNIECQFARMDASLINVGVTKNALVYPNVANGETLFEISKKIRNAMRADETISFAVLFATNRRASPSRSNEDIRNSVNATSLLCTIRFVNKCFDVAFSNLESTVDPETIIRSDESLGSCSLIGNDDYANVLAETLRRLR